MHRQLKTLLRKAYGVSESALVVTLDIRGFSAFCQTQEAPSAAQYLKRVYLRILDQYFPNPRFFKPTGDGLLIIRPYAENTLESVATSTVLSSVKLVREFGTLCSEDPTVNFPVPDSIGIGICRGPVCALIAGKKKPTTIDYSGRFLNLSARLTEMARPAGVVFDSAFGPELLPEPLQAVFAQEPVVYVRSVAEDKPMSVYYTKDYTEILPVYKSPLNEPQWRIYEWSKTLRDIERAPAFFQHLLPSRPAHSDTIRVTAQFPSVESGGKMSSNYAKSSTVQDFHYEDRAEGPMVRVDHNRLGKYLRTQGVKGPWPCTIRIAYHERAA